MVLGKLDTHMQKNEPQPLPHTIDKNLSRTNSLRVRAYAMGTLEENSVATLQDLGQGKPF